MIYDHWKSIGVCWRSQINQVEQVEGHSRGIGIIFGSRKDQHDPQPLNLTFGCLH